MSRPYSQKVVLHCPNGYQPALDSLVEDFISDGVTFIGVVGQDCDKIEDIIDEIVFGEGGEDRPFVLTTSHQDETLEDVIAFARNSIDAHAEEPQVVRL